MGNLVMDGHDDAALYRTDFAQLEVAPSLRCSLKTQVFENRKQFPRLYGRKLWRHQTTREKVVMIGVAGGVSRNL